MADLKRAFASLTRLISDDTESKALELAAHSNYNLLKRKTAQGSGNEGAFPNATPELRAAVSLYLAHEKTEHCHEPERYFGNAGVNKLGFLRALRTAKQLLAGGNAVDSSSPAKNTRNGAKTTPESTKRKLPNTRSNEDASRKKPRIDLQTSQQSSGSKKKQTANINDLMQPRASTSKLPETLTATAYNDKDDVNMEDVVESPTTQRVLRKAAATPKATPVTPTRSSARSSRSRGLSEPTVSVEVSPLRSIKQKAPLKIPTPKKKVQIEETAQIQINQPTESTVSTPTVTPTKSAASSVQSSRKRGRPRKVLEDTEIVNALASAARSEETTNPHTNNEIVDDDQIVEDLEYRTCDFELDWGKRHQVPATWLNDIKQQLSRAGYAI